MRRFNTALLGATVLTFALTFPALSAQPRTVTWVCDVPGEGLVTFVTAAEAARHGISQANSTAGQVFLNQFGEVCTVN